jgi:hypothetical protein
MTFQHRGELRADPGIAPGERNIDPPRRSSIWPSIAVVAAASAFGGVIWYAYHQSPGAGGNGTPPLVKAEPGPTKVKPDNPGGQDIPFQDSTVYDRLSSNGQKPVAEKLLPPPEEPAMRTPPAPPPAETAAVPPPPAPDAQAAQQQVAPPQQTATALPPPVDVGAPTALAPTAGAIVIQPPPPPQPKPVQSAPPSPPKAAPASIAALINEAGAGAPAAKAPAGAGGYHLQLSAVRSADAVPGEWARLKRRYPELAGLTSATHKIDTPDKGTFYRVEAGPLEEAAAKSTCTRLRGEGLGCIVVKR